MHDGIIKFLCSFCSFFLSFCLFSFLSFSYVIFLWFIYFGSRNAIMESASSWCVVTMRIPLKGFIFCLKWFILHLPRQRVWDVPSRHQSKVEGWFWVITVRGLERILGSVGWLWYKIYCFNKSQMPTYFKINSFSIILKTGSKMARRIIGRHLIMDDQCLWNIVHCMIWIMNKVNKMIRNSLPHALSPSGFMGASCARLYLKLGS